MFNGRYISKSHNVEIRAHEVKPGVDLSGFGLNRPTQELLAALPGKLWVASVEGENTTLIIPDSVFTDTFVPAQADALAD